MHELLIAKLLTVHIEYLMTDLNLLCTRWLLWILTTLFTQPPQNYHLWRHAPRYESILPIFVLHTTLTTTPWLFSYHFLSFSFGAEVLDHKLLYNREKLGSWNPRSNHFTQVRVWPNTPTQIDVKSFNRLSVFISSHCTQKPNVGHLQHHATSVTSINTVPRNNAEGNSYGILYSP